MHRLGHPTCIAIHPRICARAVQKLISPTPDGLTAGLATKVGMMLRDLEGAEWVTNP